MSLPSVLPCSTPEEIYSSLATIFVTRGNDQILDIDILPGYFEPPLIRDGCAVGITKKALVQAFVIARKVFFEGLKQDQALDASIKAEDVDVDAVVNNNNATNTPTPYTSPTTLHATEILLLLDPEHLTACNWRKRRILSLTSPHHRHNGKVNLNLAYASAVTSDIAFTTSLLRSALHRHSKSPTLWTHRYWLWAKMIELRPSSFPLSTSTLMKLWTDEVGVALEAAEQHPRNYYAFTYLRRLWGIVLEVAEEKKLQEKVAVGTTREMDTFPATVARKTLPDMTTWCLGHPADISGWSFLRFLLDQATDTTDGHGEANDVDGEGVDAAKEVRERVVAFVRESGWQGESLWLFLAGLADEDGDEVMDGQNEDVDGVGAGEADPSSSEVVDGKGVRKSQPRWQQYMRREKAKFERVAEQETTSSSI